MKNMKTFFYLTILGALFNISQIGFSAEQAYFRPVPPPDEPVFIPTRCEKDSLDVNQAFQRLDWVKKCYRKYASNKDSSTAVFRMDVLKNRLDDKNNPHPGYPTFGRLTKDGYDRNYETIDKGVKVKKEYVAPVDVNAPCFLPKGFTIVGYCVSGCYTPEMNLWFPSGYEPIETASTYQKEVMGLTPPSTLDRLQFEPSGIQYFVKSDADTWHDVLVFTTLAGHRLRVTLNHPLLDSDGNMREASTFQTGESLITATGEPDLITAIGGESYFGKVYNVALRTDHLASNVVVAEGLLNGTVKFQNEANVYLNQRLLRVNMPEELFN